MYPCELTLLRDADEVRISESVLSSCKDILSPSNCPCEDDKFTTVHNWELFSLLTVPLDKFCVELCVGVSGMYCAILLIDERMLSALDRHLPHRLVNQWRALLGLFVVPSLSEERSNEVLSVIRNLDLFLGENNRGRKRPHVIVKHELSFSGDD